MNYEFQEESLSAKILHTASINQVIAELLEDEEIDKDKTEEIVEAIIDRENRMSTYLTGNILMPRYMVENGSFRILIGLTKDRVIFKDMSLSIIILFLYTNEQSEQLYESLALFTRLFLWRTLREKVENADSDEAVEQIIIEGLKTIED